MNRISKFFDNKWTVTLISTMLGIVFGLYITSHFETRKLLRAKENALEQVANELSDNQELLQTYHEALEEKHHALANLLEVMNSNMELIIHSDSLDGFKNQVKSIFKYSASEPLPNNQIKLRGDLELYIESELIARDLSHIVWDSYKQTNYMSVTSFECLTDIEAIYSLQRELNNTNTKWKEIFYQGAFIAKPETQEDFMNLWRQLSLQQKLLLDMYGFQERLIKNCN